MKITTSFENGVLAAGIHGRFDAHTVESYIQSVADRVGLDYPEVVLDMSGVEFMDSSALAALVTTLKRCMEAGGSIVLVAASPAVRLILELTRLDEVFRVADANESGSSALNGKHQK
jgi:anti-sigma B factor antagonist